MTDPLVYDLVHGRVLVIAPVTKEAKAKNRGVGRCLASPYRRRSWAPYFIRMQRRAVVG